MLSIAKFFWQLCLLQRSPAQLPSSPFATGFVFSIYIVVALIVVSVLRPDRSMPVVATDVTVGVLTQAGITYLLLYYKGLSNRFRATWASLLGANAIMLLVLLPVNGLMTVDHSALKLFADSLTWVCLGWWLAIAGYIYHKAVNISVIQGSVIAFVTELVAAIVAFNLVGQ